MALRVRAALTALLVVVLTTVVGAGVGAASGRAPVAGSAARASTAPAVVTGVAVPAGFAARAGYVPQLEVLPSGPRWTRPDGGCSSPWGGTRYGFDAACRAHDLGYDVLRDAAATGRPWSGTARLHVDLQLAEDVLARCGSLPAGERPGCVVVAGVFAVAVGVNSVSEAFSVPGPVSFARVAVPVGGGLLVLVVGLLLARRGRWPSGAVATVPAGLALLAAAASWQPSLLPRDAPVQLAVTALTTLSVLTVGALVDLVWRRLRGSAPRVRTGPVAAALAASTLLVGATAGHAGQVRLASAEGLDALPLGESLLAGGVGALLALAATVLAVQGGRVLRRLARRVRRPGARAVAAGVLALALLPGQAASPAAAASGETLPPRLRAFVGDATPVDELAAVTGRPGAAPVRVAVPLTAGDEGVRAAAAVDALERSGGLDRGLLLVVVPTGSGWVNPAVVEAAELVTAGDVASVAVQYDDRPSWQAFLTGGGALAAVQTGALLDALQDELADRPSRPRVVLYGESLGAVGGLPASGHPLVDGAVWSGVPHAARHLVEAVAGRERVHVVEHGDDPVPAWSPRLLLGPTDGWDRGWVPFASFWGATGDLLGSLDQPVGHGHRYGPELVPALADAAGADVPAAVVRAAQEAVGDGR